MALVTLGVRYRAPYDGKSAKNYSTTEDQVVDSTLIYAVPSLCKHPGHNPDGLTNSKVEVLFPETTLTLYCTQTVAEIAALT